MAKSICSNDIVLSKDLDVSKVSYGAPKQLDNGGRSVYISYMSKNLMVQTPVMNAPFGVNVWPGERGMPDKYTLDLSFAGMETRPNVREFKDMLSRLGDQVITDALENSNLWFKKKYPSRDVIDALFTSNIRYSKDKVTGEVNNMYPPSFKLTLPYRDNAFTFPVYGSERDPVDLMDIHTSPSRGKGSKVSAIIQCTSIWFAGSKFGLTWKVCQMRISVPTVLKEYAFLSTEEDELAMKEFRAPPIATKDEEDTYDDGEREKIFV